MIFHVNNRRWEIDHEDREGLWGEADWDARRITLHSKLKHCRTKRRLEILIHEVLHACFPEEVEEVITDRARVLCGVLWSDGWRRKLASVQGSRKRRARHR